jgi:hypothetical protein
MDITEKGPTAEKIRRRFTNLLDAEHYVRGKTTFWVLKQNETIEFVHLHLFSFTTKFRVHLGIRVLNESFEDAHLNGPNTDQFRGYDAQFTGPDESSDACARDLLRFCVEVGDPWFTKWRDPVALAKATDSPLSTAARQVLRGSLRGEVDSVAVSLSKRLLGVTRGDDA